MNAIDRKRLARFGQILVGVPFSASGTATTTGLGAVMFEQDMRAVRPYLHRVLDSMLLEGAEGLEEGVDYDNPDLLLDALEGWQKMRAEAGWQGAFVYSFEYFWQRYRQGEK